MAKRLTRKLTDVIEEVRITLAAEHGISQEQLDALRARVDTNGHKFPVGSMMLPIAMLWIDYEVQRDVIIKHIISIIKRYDPRLCSPASACTDVFDMDNQRSPIMTFDGQHRTIATALLGFDAVPCIVVETDDIQFPSYAFEECNMSTKKLGPQDIHRNRLTRYKLGSREQKNVVARTLQDQFDNTGVDLEDKGTRKSPGMRGDNDYFFSHFKYAEKTIEADASGKLIYNILNSITSVFPLQEEVDQGVFIGLYELARLDQNHQELPDNWMVDVLRGVKKSFNSSSIVHSKAKRQNEHVNPGAGWSAPSNMANFLREVYMMNDGTINLPYHGEGAKMQVANNPVPGLFPNTREMELA
tara:strand:- start:254 stop:1324 length:1071 start_codon:yes stop_codon:yes gene_type:complete